MSTAYHQLEQRFRHLHLLGSISSTLHWDSATQLPPGGVPLRGEQLSLLEQQSHQLLTAPEVQDWLLEAEQHLHSLTTDQVANLRRMQHIHAHTTAVPEALATELVEKGSACEYAWREARQNSDFSAFARHFAPVLALVRQKAQSKAEALNLAPYDALLDGYDTGRRMAQITPLFHQLATEIPSLIQQRLERQGDAPPALHLSVSDQQQLGRHLAHTLGFDLSAGRMDVSTHPFCGGLPGDVRITARYHAEDPINSLMGVLHETGHALYEQGLPADWFGQPLGEAMGMTLHESQSLIIEMQFCRSRGFMRYLANHWPETVQADVLYAHATRVERSFIRVDADELTYPMHIILRTRLEQQLLDGSLHLDDLPDAWNTSMQQLLGITPPDAKHGCLQDIHWTDGSFGYFPTYSLGAMAAAQLRMAMEQTLPDWEEQLALGDWSAIRHWLRQHVHQFGSRLTADNLLEQATGAPLGSTAYLTHLRNRYLP